MNASGPDRDTTPCSGGVVVYVGLGSNLDDPVDQVARALDELGEIPESCCFACSRLYNSPPIGPPGQPDYVNAAAGLTTRLDPHTFLSCLQEIEEAHGRTRGVRWGPRTLDLDLLLYGERRIDTPDLQVPHPGLHRRPFVLLPLREIAPAGLHVPGLGVFGDIVAACPGPEGEVVPIAPDRRPRG